MSISILKLTECVIKNFEKKKERFSCSRKTDLRSDSLSNGDRHEIQYLLQFRSNLLRKLDQQ